MVRTPVIRLLVILWGVALVVGCGSAEPGAASKRASLKPLDDCGQVLETLQARAIREMEKRVDENMAYYFQYQEWCEAWSRDSYGDELNSYDADAGPTTGMSPGAESDGGSSSGASQYSTTNNQVAGVDEADLLKNDGAYIYIVANGELQIIDAWPAAQAEVITRVAIEGEPKRLFVADDHALVYSSLEPVGSGSYYGGECVYGYDCDFTGDGRRLKITVLDITDRTHPVLVREMRFSGAYLNARRVDSAVYTAVVFPPLAFPDLVYWPEELEQYWWCGKPESPWKVRLAFAKLKWKNRAIIEGSGITDWLPSIEDTRYADGHRVKNDALLRSCSGFFASSQPDGQSFLSLVAVDIADPATIGITTIVGKPGAVYASRDALYVAARNQSGYSYYSAQDGSQPQETSAVHKFRLEAEPVGTTYLGSGEVKGRVLNQFAMDEWEGHLRMATTTGRVPNPAVHSTISVLAERAGALEVVGLIDQIAPTEDIRSARFSGKKAFIVTFKKTDPLFSFDLSDPKNPRILGELKIPGFSTYMHLMDETHLLSIGYDADDQGSFAWFQGILLQIFDISDMSNPTLVHREVIGSRGSTSDAATNHLAFNYFGALGLLAIPMTICEGSSGGGSYGDVMTFSGLLVYDVSVANGFSRRGGVSHVDPATTDYGSCGNWWTSSNSVVKRSIFMDDFVYSVALDQIKIQNLATLGQDLATVSLVPPEPTTP